MMMSNNIILNFFMRNDYNTKINQAKTIMANLFNLYLSDYFICHILQGCFSNLQWYLFHSVSCPFSSG